MNRRAALSLLMFCTALSAVCSTATAKPRDIDPALLTKLVERMAEPYEDADKFDAEVWLLISDSDCNVSRKMR